MINRRLLLVGMVVASILVVAIFLGYPEIIRAAESKEGPPKQCAIVDINRNNTIEPVTLKIAKDDCIRWLNWGNGAEVIFSEGEKSKDMTKDPVRFKMDSEGRYATDYFGHNETASLVFPKRGTFNYEVKFRGNKQVPGVAQNRIIGTIVVE
jgi:hypothetical protein